MIPRIRDRLKALETRIMPPPLARVFAFFMDDQSPLSRDEQLAAFKAEHGVTAFDHLVVMTFS
jgi:hypothetical protein